MAAHKGHKKAGGRKKGTPNKLTTAVKDMIRQALEEAGGVEYLVAQSRDNPTAFLALVGKLVPLDMTSSDGSMSPSAVRFVPADDAKD